MYRNLLCVAGLVTASALNVSAAVTTVEPVVGIAWFHQLLEWPLSIFFGPSAPAMIQIDEHIPDITSSPCLVLPLGEITDPAAVEFELSRGSDGVVQTSGMTSAAALALQQFDILVSRYGGTVEVKSAFRPPAYQEHLQNVWDKWMWELRDNNQSECQDLRAQVYEEFAGHALLESQRPAGISDHSRGTAFDAAVYLPRVTRTINIDTLARRAGLYRPVAFQDPVHFRLGVPKMVKMAGKRAKASQRRV